MRKHRILLNKSVVPEKHSRKSTRPLQSFIDGIRPKLLYIAEHEVVEKQKVIS
jgi:hypothetical protein